MDTVMDSNWILVMDGGKTVELGDPFALKEKRWSYWTAALFETAEENYMLKFKETWNEIDTYRKCDHKHIDGLI